MWFCRLHFSKQASQDFCSFQHFRSLSASFFPWRVASRLSSHASPDVLIRRWHRLGRRLSAWLAQFRLGFVDRRCLTRTPFSLQQCPRGCWCLPSCLRAPAAADLMTPYCSYWATFWCRRPLVGEPWVYFWIVGIRTHFEFKMTAAGSNLFL